MHKQQVNIIGMREKSIDAGFSISYTTVRNFVNSETAKVKKFIFVDIASLDMK